MLCIRQSAPYSIEFTQSVWTKRESINEDDDIETTISFHHRLHNRDDVIIDAIDVTQTTESIDSSKCDQVSASFFDFDRDVHA